MSLINRKKISVVAPCYNEEDNVEELYVRVKAALSEFSEYDHEIIFIDNHSLDQTEKKLRKLASIDKSVKLIINTRNFGHIRSPYYGIMQSSGDAIIYLATDLQDPPELIVDFIKFWQDGFKVVMAVKPVSQTSTLMHLLRKGYYRFLDDISEVKLLADSTGFGLYDKVVIDHIRKIEDPYPYFRGLVCELGYEIKPVEFIQPRRQRGITKNNFFTLYDIAMLGIISHSKVPLRLAALVGFALGAISLFAALVFLVLKLMFWNTFPIGIAPLVISQFFMFGILLFFIGLLGEYIGSIHTYIKKRPVVVEKERVNFEDML